MSRTYEIACHDCKLTLWLGQGPTSGEVVGAYIYKTEDDLRRLQDFLFCHMHHRLEFGDAEAIDGADLLGEYESIYP